MRSGNGEKKPYNKQLSFLIWKCLNFVSVSFPCKFESNPAECKWMSNYGICRRPKNHKISTTNTIHSFDIHSLWFVAAILTNIKLKFSTGNQWNVDKIWMNIFHSKLKRNWWKFIGFVILSSRISEYTYTLHSDICQTLATKYTYTYAQMNVYGACVSRCTVDTQWRHPSKRLVYVNYLKFH